VLSVALGGVLNPPKPRTARRAKGQSAGKRPGGGNPKTKFRDEGRGDLEKKRKEGEGGGRAGCERKVCPILKKKRGTTSVARPGPRTLGELARRGQLARDHKKGDGQTLQS